MTVRAARDAVILEIDRRRIEELFAESPDFSLAVSRSLAAQVRNTIDATTAPSPRKVIAVLAADTGTSSRPIAAAFAASLEQWGPVTIFDADPGSDLPMLLDRFEARRTSRAVGGRQRRRLGGPGMEPGRPRRPRHQ